MVERMMRSVKMKVDPAFAPLEANPRFEQMVSATS
jgi:hypothetical protein